MLSMAGEIYAEGKLDARVAEKNVESSVGDKVFIDNTKTLEPEIVRKDLKESEIKAYDFEIGPYVGLMSVEDFGANLVYGVSLTYHVTEDFFFVANYGETTTEESSYERLSGSLQLLADDQRDLSYYNINVGYQILPGEAFVGRNVAFNTALYFVIGAGNTTFAGDTQFTINAGAGYQFLALDWLSIKIDVRDHIFEHDIFGEIKSTHNLEFTIGATLFR